MIFPDNTEEGAWLRFLEEQGNNYPNIAKLVMIMFIVPMSNAPCERGFSALNLIENRLRNCLSNILDI